MRRWRYALGAMAWMSLVFIFSSLPAERLGPDSMSLDVLKKVGHGVEFGVLAILYLYAMKGGRPVAEAGMVVFLLSFFFTVLFAATDEYHQSFTPGRHSSVVDVFIDSCGAIVFLGYFYRWQNRKNITRLTARNAGNSKKKVEH